MDRFILSLDQGTTSSRAILFDVKGNTIAVAQKEFGQYFPRPGWVEHDALEIWESQIHCLKECIEKSGIKPVQIACIGISNQRETTVVWNRKTGKPIYRAIVWQCRRTSDFAEELKRESNEFREKTGLVPDAYFSGPKLKWILDNVEGARQLAESGELAFGTIDTWLIWNLTGGETHATEPSNASRTMMFNMHSLKWDDMLLKRLDVPAAVLPEIKSSDAYFGKTSKEVVGFEAPITGVLGDQQAALFGQSCLESGMAKCTYGTGAFLLINIGEAPQVVPGLLTTLAWQLSGRKPTYALEGAIFITGAAVQWLRDGLGIIKDSSECEGLARSLDSNEGVYFVPAFVGLGSPYWNSDARGTIVGLTRGSSKAHIVRAAVEAMAYQVKDVEQEISKHKLSMRELRVDGGATRNEFMLQFQADLLRAPIVRSGQIESTAWGAAAIAALGSGLIGDINSLPSTWESDKRFVPLENREIDYLGWQKALQASIVSTAVISEERSVICLAK